MSDELLQKESHSQSSKFSIFFKMFSFLIPLLDVIKLIIASVTSVVFLAFACLTLGGSALALIVSTPLFIIFSPILVPATIATTLLATGLAAGTTLGVTAIGLILGLIKTAEGISLARSAQSPFRKALSSRFGGSKRFSGGGAAPGAGGGTRAVIIKKILQWIEQRQGAGGGTLAKFIKKFVEWLKKQQGMKGMPAGGDTSTGGSTPAGGAEPAGGAKPAGEAKPASGGTPTE